MAFEDEACSNVDDEDIAALCLLFVDDENDLCSVELDAEANIDFDEDSWVIATLCLRSILEDRDEDC
jgi:hypothetical protein